MCLLLIPVVNKVLTSIYCLPLGIHHLVLGENGSLSILSLNNDGKCTYSITFAFRCIFGTYDDVIRPKQVTL